MPDAGDVLRPDSSQWDLEQVGKDRPAAQAHVAGNDPADIRETESRLLDRAADGALGHRKVGRDKLTLLVWAVPVRRLTELVEGDDPSARRSAFHHDRRRGV